MGVLFTSVSSIGRLTLAGALLLAARGARAETYKYSVIINGQESGAQTTTMAPDGRVTVDFSYRDTRRSG